MAITWNRMLSTFDGTDAITWVEESTQYFASKTITDVERTQRAWLYVEGEALEWYDEYVEGKDLPWNDFIVALLKRFDATAHDSLVSGDKIVVDKTLVSDESDSVDEVLKLDDDVTDDICVESEVGHFSAVVDKVMALDDDDVVDVICYESTLGNTEFVWAVDELGIVDDDTSMLIEINVETVLIGSKALLAHDGYVLAASEVFRRTAIVAARGCWFTEPVIVGRDTNLPFDRGRGYVIYRTKAYPSSGENLQQYQVLAQNYQPYDRVKCNVGWLVTIDEIRDYLVESGLTLVVDRLLDGAATAQIQGRRYIIERTMANLPFDRGKGSISVLEASLFPFDRGKLQGDAVLSPSSSLAASGIVVAILFVGRCITFVDQNRLVDRRHGWAAHRLKANSSSEESLRQYRVVARKYRPFDRGKRGAVERVTTCTGWCLHHP